MEFTNIDVIEIMRLKEHLKKNADKDEWFEIGGESAKLLYKYITSIENTLECLQDYMNKDTEKEEK